MIPALYNQGVSMDANLTYSVQVQLRDPLFPYNVIESQTAPLYMDGSTTATFQNSGSYYVSVQHRNAIAKWSAMPLLITGSQFYDFSTGPSAAYGSNEIETEPGIWAMFSGDLNQDENIDLLDLSVVEADINNFSFGSSASDLNGDGNVDLLDSPMLESNIASFVFSNHP